MKAIIQENYGHPNLLKLKEIEKPVPSDNEVLVKVHYASVHPDVWHVVSGQPFVLRLMGSGLLKPKVKIPGTDMSGIVDSVGKNVTRFKPGDEVFGETLTGMQWINGGTYAEYVSVKEESLIIKPQNITFEEAAAIPTAGLIALYNLKNGELVKPGDKVLVNGAGGGVGTLAVQIIRAFGGEVTGVDNSTKSDLIKSLGADHFIDYTKEDFTNKNELYDLIFDIPGNHPFSKCRRVLKPEGSYILIGHDNFGKANRPYLGSIPLFFKFTIMSIFISQLKDMGFSVPNKKDAMAALNKLVQDGSVKPLIDKTFPLNKTSEALEYLINGNAPGRIVIAMS